MIMASLTIRNLPDDVHRALRVKAARNGNSTEAEARAILKQGSLENKLLPLFIRHVLPFDIAATQAYADVMSRARIAGKAQPKPLYLRGLQVGVIGRTHHGGAGDIGEA